MIKDISKKNIKQKKMLVSRNLIDDTKKDLQLFNINCIGSYTNKEGQAYFLNKKRFAGDIKTYEIKAFGTTISFNMKYCPNGSFERGIDQDDINNNTMLLQKMDRSKTLARHCGPKATCQITNGFWMSESLVNKELFLKVMGWFRADVDENLQTIVDNSTWFTCIDFCNKLSKILGLEPCYIVKDVEIWTHTREPEIKNAKVSLNMGANGFRLPTETEWEYAAKAGQIFNFAGSNNLNEVCQHNGHYERGIRHIQKNHKKENIPKQFKPNAWGIYDMSGYTQWCIDFHLPYSTIESLKGQDQFYVPKYFVDESYNKQYDRTSKIDPFLFGDNVTTNNERVVRGGSPSRECIDLNFLNVHRDSKFPYQAEGGIRLVCNALANSTIVRHDLKNNQ